MATTSTRKRKSRSVWNRTLYDKEGNEWHRDAEGRWKNKYGTIFTNNEYKTFSKLINQANKKIQAYMEKYPYRSELKVKDIGSRLRDADLSRFRRRSSYRSYLRVTKRIISGSQLYSRLPEQYRKNYIKGLSSDQIKMAIKNNPKLKDLINYAKYRIRLMSANQLILLSREATAPDINIYYTPQQSVIEHNINMLINTIEIIAG